jgi:hypothetical protein
VSIRPSVRKVLFWLAESGELSQSAIKNLSGVSERSIRYALAFLKQEGHVVEVINLSDVRKKKYKVCASVAQLGEHSSCKRTVGGANPPRGLELK